ncbi:DegT/DnrJ/EryC1/StrS family aminotransferase [Actinomycetospora endophytica]|uniref:DegT/DnrJ/EryC1/StrS family aminotransferase n=1 Tax=Actinomycetospora endophytica TaxID=2291215 RepID=A0ABS8PC44_9PSEU|nr:DegT/DnrJ/EryC1/StrS family aminotransferase [Actinomycetospora endophytica]MCD2195822.1 DegT/DnrJ/EryC1/StrS family aminotransferase [Actinomycetospora endophytica]
MTLLGPRRPVREPVPFLDLPEAHRRIRPELDAAWSAVLDHGAYVGGPEVARFEREFADHVGVGACVGVANGTDALELILAALGIGRGDEVVVPTNTFVATAEAVRAVGARPRFVDVRPHDLLVDPAAVEAAIGPRTAAVVAVHLFGQVADMPALDAIARRHGLALVEDAAQAHGARLAGRRAGALGHAAAFSFYPGKNLGALGDGGAVTSADAGLVDRVRVLADHGRDPHDRHVHRVSGRNSRLDTVQAAVLRVRLRGLDADNAARRRVVATYRDLLPESCRVLAVDPRGEPVHHLAVVEIDDREAATDALTAAGIGWGIHYPIPCHRQPAFAGDGPPPSLPVADAAAARILSLPCSPGTTTDQIERVAAVLADHPRRDR